MYFYSNTSLSSDKATGFPPYIYDKIYTSCPVQTTNAPSRSLFISLDLPLYMGVHLDNFEKKNLRIMQLICLSYIYFLLEQCELFQ